jgi:hypothetical protein
VSSLAALDPVVRRIVDEVGSRLLEQGAKAVLLTGSHARGEAAPDSDVDVFAVGDGPAESFDLVHGRLVGVHWWTPDTVRQRMLRPESAVVAVLGWRDALVVHDPQGVAAELKREADEWSWQKIEREADLWVCDQLVGWAEYVMKLVRALRSGRELDAAALRAQTVLKLAELLAVRRRVVSPSENGLWATIADAGGEEWRAAEQRALGTSGEDVESSARAAVRLFELLAADVSELLDDRQREVIEHALEVASEPRPSEAA